MKSLLSKGYSYLETYPKSRILTTLLNFDIAICCFILMNLFLGRKMDLSQIVLSFIGWDSVGNSNWYIFIILWCYLSFYVVFIQRHDLLSIILLLIAFISLRYLCYTHPLHGLTRNLKSIVFSLLIVSMTMKFRLGNRWLQCAGSVCSRYIFINGYR